jgi:hypothetical protein
MPSNLFQTLITLFLFKLKNGYPAFLIKNKLCTLLLVGGSSHSNKIAWYKCTIKEWSLTTPSMIYYFTKNIQQDKEIKLIFLSYKDKWIPAVKEAV